ncbi:hypothetical protein [Citrobacter farmeri]|uniref:hypothetical protein n=1 Tax=Citrobacter farmeri TaxID=67824 RepID=UPI003890235A|nr:hypothetical protein [Citrobacter farmeri]
MPASTFDVMDLVSKLGVGIITGSVAAIVTTKVALNKFYHEKWWEKKHAAYNQLIDNLFEINAIYKSAYNFYARCHKARLNHTPEPEDDFNWQRFYEVSAQVHRFYATAPISLSHHTRSLLADYFKKESDSDYSVYEEGYPDFVAYDDMANITQKLIDAIVLDAETELKFK